MIAFSPNPKQEFQQCRGSSDLFVGMIRTEESVSMEGAVRLSYNFVETTKSK